MRHSFNADSVCVSPLKDVYHGDIRDVIILLDAILELAVILLVRSLRWWWLRTN
jgi:hypothetical protein